MEFLIWIAFLIVYSIVQSLGKKKKPAPQSPNQVPGEQQRMPTLEDALREIQEALQQSKKPQRDKQESPAPEQPVLSPTSSSPRKTTLSPHPALQGTREPEFHSLEKRIPERATLEARTTYSEKILDKGSLEAEKTYEDVFPESSFYDDSYSHAHMETPKQIKKVKAPESPAAILRKRLKDPTYLSEAFVVQQILGPPVSKRR